jgi:hypothetical protein
VNDEVSKDQKALEIELRRVQGHLQANHGLLEELASEHSRWEQEIDAMRRHVTLSANQDLQQGMRHPSAATLQIESDLNQVQQNCQVIKKRIQEVTKDIQALHAKQDFLTNEIRPSPTGVAGAEQVPSKKRANPSWIETDIDSGQCNDRSQELDAQMKAEIKAKNAGSTYINAYEEEDHSYENTNFNDQDDDDEVQTVHSEGVRSEAPPLPSKGPNKMINILSNDQQENNSTSSSEMYSLGDISEADDRVKKFFGLLPKNNVNQQQQQQIQAEIKTVRMVKRDSKERSISRGQEQMCSPAPLPPRGNYQNVHDFLTAYNNQSSEESLNYTLKASTLPSRSATTSPDMNEASITTIIPSKSSFRLTQYYRKKVIIEP